MVNECDMLLAGQTTHPVTVTDTFVPPTAIVKYAWSQLPVASYQTEKR